MLTSRPLWLVACFAAIVELPVFGFFQAFYADWSYAYLVANVPSIVDGGLVLLAAFLTPTAFLWTTKAATLGEFEVVSRAVLGLGGGFLGVLLFGWKRFSTLGTIFQYRTQTGLRSIADARFSAMLVLAWFALGLGVWLTWRELRRSHGTDT